MVTVAHEADRAPVRLHVRAWAPAGESVAPAFILVHGLSSNARLWDEVAAIVAAAGHPAYAIDLRSHGASDQPTTGYDTATAARDVAAVADELGLRGAVVAGQSWGGNVVVSLAAAFPEVVGALALVDGGWLDLSASFDSWAACEAALRPHDVAGLPAGRMRQFLRGNHPDWSATAIDATMANLRVLPDDTMARRLPIPQHLRILRSMWDDPPWPYFAKISVPVLFLPATSTDAARAQTQRMLIERATAALSRATVREFPGADHDLHAQHPTEIATELLKLAELADN